jgi:peptidoglycan hydrolase CwlO-like protein
MSLSEWFVSELAARVAAKLPAPSSDAAALAELKEEIVTLTEAVAKLNPASDAAVAKIAELGAANATLTADGAAKDATIADLTAQRDAAQANASDPADERPSPTPPPSSTVALNPPAPPEAPANP